MDSKNNDSCAICSKQPEDMLLLQCTHNLCLDCATQLFAASQQEHLQCEICFVRTLLDHQTVKCLTSLAAQVNHAASRRSQPFVPKPPKQIKQPKGLQCYQHKQAALYYCFDCQNGNICSQCILGPSHLGHKVFTVKKASKIFAQNLIGISKDLENQKMKIEQDLQWVQIKKDELTKQLKEKQNKLKLLFDDILQQVGTRYNELSAQLERQSMRGIEIIEGSVNSMNQKLGLIENAIQQNRMAIRQNDSQKIMRRFTQLSLQKDSYTPQLPANLPHNSLFLNNEEFIFSQVESLMRKVSWGSGTQRSKQNRSQYNNVIVETSLISQQKQASHYPQFYMNHLQQKNYNQSLSNYSGIKMNSRRLQLSRSMNNATNIINKLQERIRK